MFSSRKKIKIQGKTKAHKKALVKSQVIELIRNGRIKTTPKKAKLLKSNFDKLITKYKKGTDHSKNQVISFLGAKNKRAFDRLGQIIENQLQGRNSGYTRVIKTLPRKGDAAEQAYVMIVNTEVKEKKSKIQSVLNKQEEESKKGKGKRKKTSSTSKKK